MPDWDDSAVVGPKLVKPNYRGRSLAIHTETWGPTAAIVPVGPRLGKPQYSGASQGIFVDEQSPTLHDELIVGPRYVRPQYAGRSRAIHVRTDDCGCDLIDDFDRIEASGWNTASYFWPISLQHLSWFVLGGVTASVASGYGILTLPVSSAALRGAVLISPAGYSSPIVIPEGFGYGTRTSFVADVIETSSRFRITLGGGSVEVNLASGLVTVTRFGFGVTTPGVATATLAFDAGTEYGISLDIHAATAEANIWVLGSEDVDTITSGIAATPELTDSSNVALQLVGSGGAAFTVAFGKVYVTPCDRPISRVSRKTSLSWIWSRLSLATTTGVVDSIDSDVVFHPSGAVQLQGLTDTYPIGYDIGNGHNEQRQWLTTVTPPETDLVRIVGTIIGTVDTFADPTEGSPDPFSCRCRYAFGVVNIGTAAPVSFDEVATDTANEIDVFYNGTTVTTLDFDEYLPVAGPAYDDGNGYLSRLFQVSWWNSSQVGPGYRATGDPVAPDIAYGCIPRFPDNADHQIVGMGPTVDFSTYSSLVELDVSRMYAYGEHGRTPCD